MLKQAGIFLAVSTSLFASQDLSIPSFSTDAFSNIYSHFEDLFNHLSLHSSQIQLAIEENHLDSLNNLLTEPKLKNNLKDLTIDELKKLDTLLDALVGLLTQFEIQSEQARASLLCSSSIRETAASRSLADYKEKIVQFCEIIAGQMQLKSK